LKAGNEILDEIQREAGRLDDPCALGEATRRPPGFSEKSRTESDDEIRSLMQFAGYGMAKVALDGRILVCNPMFSQLLGYSTDELERMAFADITHPDDVKEDWDNVLELIKGASDSYWMRKRYIHRKGSIVWATIQVWAVRDSGQRLRYLAGIVQPAAAQSSPRIVAG
jgi:PAS domain S-box-containing protein